MTRTGVRPTAGRRRITDRRVPTEIERLFG
jgi:hypothetical protein